MPICKSVQNDPEPRDDMDRMSSCWPDSNWWRELGTLCYSLVIALSSCLAQSIFYGWDAHMPCQHCSPSICVSWPNNRLTGLMSLWAWNGEYGQDHEIVICGDCLFVVRRVVLVGPPSLLVCIVACCTPLCIFLVVLRCLYNNKCFNRVTYVWQWLHSTTSTSCSSTCLSTVFASSKTIWTGLKFCGSYLKSDIH